MSGDLPRVKRRYLLVRLVPAGVQVAPEELRQQIVEELLKIGGWVSLAEAGLSIRRYERGCEFLLRCSLRSLPIVLLALTMVRRVGGENVRLDVLRVGGTIKGLKRG
ncbi:MAG: Rpp14/Pop5 family protein [Nitrososphaerota archaeon]|nr:Rpp14/Pop5 family protein [Nitrososphaerota archaeon]